MAPRRPPLSVAIDQCFEGGPRAPIGERLAEESARYVVREIDTALQIGMVIFSQMTLLDLAGPQLALLGHGHIHLISQGLDAVMTDFGVAILPTQAFRHCPPDLDILFVPGAAAHSKRSRTFT